MKERICVECGVTVAGRYIRKRCRPCYGRVMRALKPKKERVSRVRHPGERVLARSEAGPSACIIYTGTRDQNGYGYVSGGPGRGHRPMLAYRAVYEYMVGEPPAGIDLDHACHSRDLACLGGSECIHRRCVNPHHLEPVTRAENLKRGRNPSAVNARKTHCKHGHEFTPENTLLQKELRADGTPRRKCRTCCERRSKSRSIKAL